MVRPGETGAEQERTVRSALASWARTARLCTIYVVSRGLPLAVLVEYWLFGVKR
jgi:hypothetical protein